MRLLVSRNVHVDTEAGTVVKPAASGSESNPDACVVLDAPDSENFELRVTNLDEEDENTFYLGISHVCTDFTNDDQLPTRLRLHGYFIHGDCFSVDGASDPDKQYLFPDFLTTGSVLSMRYADGVLEYQVNKRGWKGIDTVLGHRVPAGRYQPVVLIQKRNYPLALHLTRKRRCHDPTDPARATYGRVWGQRRFTDSVVCCEGIRFAVHRAILCAASPVFEAAFTGSMCEAREAELEIKGSISGAVGALLEYIYTGVLPKDVAELLPALLDLSVQYQVDALIEEVADAMLQGLTPHNVQERARALKRHMSCEPVRGACWELVRVLRGDASLLLHAL